MINVVKSSIFRRKKKGTETKERNDRKSEWTNERKNQRKNIEGEFFKNYTLKIFQKKPMMCYYILLFIVSPLLINYLIYFRYSKKKEKVMVSVIRCYIILFSNPFWYY